MMGRIVITKALCFFIYMINLILAEHILPSSSSSTTKAKPSIMTTGAWTTATSGGTTVHMQITYTQSEKYISTTSSPSSGSTGLGSLSGEVGKVRSYSHKTIHDNSAFSMKSPVSVLGIGISKKSIILLLSSLVALATLVVV